MKNKYSKIIFANMAEAMEEITNDISGNKKLLKIQEELSLSDRIILWENDNKIVITPKPIPTSLLERNIKNLGFTNIKNIFPCKVAENISREIINNKNIWDKVVKIIKNNPGINLSPYSITNSFLTLINKLSELKLKFNVNEKPCENNEWLISYLDSKIGSRTEINKIKSSAIKTPESFICKNIKEAINIARWFWNSNRSCVLKTNFGESGWGVMILRRKNYKFMEDLSDEILKKFNMDAIWSKHSMLIEEYIDPIDAEYKFPSAELYLADKDFKVTYICNQIINEDGEFIGITIGRNLMNKSVKSKILKISYQIGKKFWKLGYRGFFDIDFIISRNGTPFPIETNMRRTGGTHVYDVAKTLFGKKWERECYCISNNQFYYGGKVLCSSDILDKLDKVLYPIGSKKEGVIVILVNEYKPAFGFIVISDNKENVMRLYYKMINKLI